MKSIETSIIIKSDPETIWATLMNFKNYSLWNPFIKNISGQAGIGEQLEVTLLLDADKPMVMKPTVTEYSEAKYFGWLGHLFVKGLFDGHHCFIIEPLENGSVKFIHREEFGGILVGPLLKLVGKKTEAGFVAMNQALKNKVENSTILSKAS